MKWVERILRIGFAIMLIVQSGGVFFSLPSFQRPEPSSWAGKEFLISLFSSGYIFPMIGGVFLISGILLLISRTIGLGLAMLVPLSLNLLLFQWFLDRNLANSIDAIALAAVNVLLIGMNYRRFRSLVNR